MGNIKPTFIKRGAEKLMEEHSSELTTDFDKNQDIVRKYIIANKFIKNKVAGYITRKMRNKGKTNNYIKKRLEKSLERKSGRPGQGRRGGGGRRSY